MCNPQCSCGNARCTTVLLKALSNWMKYDLDINVYNFENWLFLIVLCLRISVSEKMKELSELSALNHKKLNIFYIIDNQGYRYESGLPSFHVGSLEITLTVPISLSLSHLNHWTNLLKINQRPRTKSKLQIIRSGEF